MSRREAFKNALCQCRVPGGHDWLSPAARTSCRRRAGHKGPHRNRLLEWDSGSEEFRSRATGEVVS